MHFSATGKFSKLTILTEKGFPRWPYGGGGAAGCGPENNAFGPLDGGFTVCF